MKCSNCNAEIADNSVFCPFCGTQHGEVEEQWAEPDYNDAYQHQYPERYNFYRNRNVSAVQKPHQYFHPGQRHFD